MRRPGRMAPAAAHPCLTPARASGTCHRRSPHRRRRKAGTALRPILVPPHSSGRVMDAFDLAESSRRRRDRRCRRGGGGVGAGAAGVGPGAGVPRPAAAAAGNRHASTRLAHRAAVSPSSPSAAPPRSGSRSREAHHPRQRPGDAPGTRRASPPRASPRNGASRTGFRCRCRPQRSGWKARRSWRAA